MKNRKMWGVGPVASKRWMTEAFLIAGDWIEDDTAPDNVVRMMQEGMILAEGRVRCN